ncbi:MAG: DUF3857 domain-containing protein [Lentisphaeraceae bacterium]|nr:DUF3857 domain-containing protein [Lentisphaeraceae bacterium]
MLGIIIALICLAKAAKSFNEPRHNKFCSIVFIAFCFIWMMSKAGGMLLKEYVPYDFNLISLYLVLLMITYGVCFILGLAATIKFDKKVYDSGKSQAVTVIILSLIFAYVQYFQYEKLQKELTAIVESPDEQVAIVNNENNYSLILPEKSDYKVLKQTNSLLKEADFILKHDSNRVFFMVVSQKIGIDTEMNTDEFYDLVQENQRDAYKSFKDIETKTTTLDGFPAKDHVYSINIGKQKFTYHSVALVHNGMFFQLTAYSTSSSNPKHLKEHTKKLKKYFKILDKNKKYYTHDLNKLQKFTSTVSPYELDLSNNEHWFNWDEFETECPESEFAGRTADTDVSFCTSAISIDTSKYSQEELANAMIRDFDISLGSESVTLVKKNEEDIYPSYTIKAAREIDSEDYEYTFKIYFTKNSVFRIAVWGLKDNEFTGQAVDSILKNLTIKDQEHELKDSFSEDLSKKQAEIWNYLGVILYDLEKYEDSIECYLKAFNFNNSKTVAVTNYFLSLNNLGQHNKIIEFLDKHPNQLADANVLSWLAYSYKQTGNFDAAKDNYYLLFTENKNYSNDEDFVDYIEILSNQKKFEVIAEVSSIYLKSHREQKLYHELINLFMENEQLEQASHQFDQLPQKYQKTIDTRRLHLKYLISKGDFKAADKNFQALLKEGYRDKTTLYTGAELYYDIGWYTHAKSTLTELLKIAPNDKAAKELMDYTLSYLGEGEKGNTTEKIDPVALPSQVSDLIAQNTKSEIEGDIKYNYHITSYEYENKRLKKTIYRKFVLTSTKGVKDNSTMYYTYSPTNSSLYVNKLTVTSPDGKSVVTSDRNAFYLTEADDEQASEDKTLCMPVSALEPGCTVEYTLTEYFYGKYNFFPFKRYWLTLTVPNDLTCVTISGDIDEIACDLKNSSSEIIKDDKNIVIAPKEKIVYKSEPEAVDAELVYPIVYIGNKTESWESEVSDYLEKIKNKLTPSPSLSTLVNSIIQSAESTEQKVRLLTNYIQDNITYKAIEFGTRGTIPDLPEKVLKQKYGDCKDVAVLLHQMLKTINIKSTLTLVNTDFILRPGIADLDQFNHMILYVDELDSFIDCTLKNIDLLSLGNVYNYDSRVLLLKKDKPIFKTVPFQKVTENTLTVNREISLNSDQSLFISEEITVKDYYAYFIRRSLLSKDEEGKQDKLKNFISFWPGISDFNATVENLDSPQKDLILKMNYKVTNAVKKLKKEFTANLTSPWLMYYFTVRECPERFSPFHVFYDIKLESTTRFKSSAESKITFTPVNHKFEKDFATGSVIAEKDNHYISIKIHSELNKGIYPVEAYSDYFSTFQNYIKNANIHFKISE